MRFFPHSIRGSSYIFLACPVPFFHTNMARIVALPVVLWSSSIIFASKDLLFGEMLFILY